MSTLETLNNGETGLSHRTKLNDNFDALNTDKVETTVEINGNPLSSDITLDQDDIGDGTTNKQFSATEQNKLAGIDSGAEANVISTVADTDEIDLTLTGKELKADLKPTTVSPGSYTNSNITVDSKGRITSAFNGSGGILAGNTDDDLTFWNTTTGKWEPKTITEAQTILDLVDKTSIQTINGGKTFQDLTTFRGGAQIKSTTGVAWLYMYGDPAGDISLTTIGGNVNLGSTSEDKKWLYSTTPTLDNELVTKKYVDDNAGSGGVTSANNITADNIVVGDDGAKGVKDGGVKISELSKEFTVSNITSSVSPAVTNTIYLVDASSGAITISLPDVTADDTSEYRIRLVTNTNRVAITTVGGTQLIDGATTIYNQTIGAMLYLKANGSDGYDIITDTREYYREVKTTGNTTLDLSTNGCESSTIYNVKPGSGNVVTYIIPDFANTCQGDYCKFILTDEGSVVVKTESGELIEGLTEQDINIKYSGFEITCLEDAYNITQDSRPKVQNTSLILYSLTESSTILDPDAGFTYYKQTCTSIEDSRFNKTTAQVVTLPSITGDDIYAGGLISDAGIIQGVLPEGPVECTCIFRTDNTKTFNFYVEYYKYEADTTETLLGTTNVSATVTQATFTDFTVTATLPETSFISTDRILRKIYLNKVGSVTATGSFSAEGPSPSFSIISIGAGSISHNILAGIQGGTAGEYYHTTAGQNTIIGKLDTKGANIASATTTDIGAATGNSVNITGTTTITGLGTIQAGTQRTLTFDGVLTLTYNATSLILPTSADIDTEAGDTADFISLGSGNWICTNYQRKSGEALVGGGGGDTVNFETLTANKTLVDGDDVIQVITTASIYRTVTLPIIPVKGMRFYIKNNNVYNSTYYIFVKAGSTTIDEVYPQAMGYYIYDGTQWMPGDGTSGGETSYGSNVSVGKEANGTNLGASVGFNSNGSSFGAALGYSAIGVTNGVAIGRSADGRTNGVSVGYLSKGGTSGVGIGRSAEGENYGLALGYRVESSGDTNSYSGAIGWNFKNDKDDYLAFCKGTGTTDTTSARVGFDFTESGKVAVEIFDSSSAPTTVTNKLYSVAGSLYRNGTLIA